MRMRLMRSLFATLLVLAIGGWQGASADEPSADSPKPAAEGTEKEGESEKDELKGGFSPLHFAVMRGNAKEVKRLLKEGADVNVPQAMYRGAPLQYAASAGKVDMVRLLISNDATVDSVDANGRTPLIWAAQQGKADVVRVLLEAGANIGAANDGGWTPLHYAMSYNHKETIEVLLKAGASVELLNRQGKTPLDVKGTNELKEE